MYEGKIVAEAAVAVPADVYGTLDGRWAPDGNAAPRGSTALGLVLLIVALPLLAARLFVWAVARDLRRVRTLASIVGAAAIDARTR